MLDASDPNYKNRLMDAAGKETFLFKRAEVVARWKIEGAPQRGLHSIMAIISDFDSEDPGSIPGAASFFFCFCF